MLKLLVFKWLLNRVLLETECSEFMLFWRFASVKFIRSFLKFPFLIYLFKQFLFSYQHHWKHHSSTDIIMVTLFCFSSVFFPRNASFSCFFLSYCFNSIVKPKCKTPINKLLKGYICYIFLV